jgi:hypothetical protein
MTFFARASLFASPQHKFNCSNGIYRRRRLAATESPPFESGEINIQKVNNNCIDQMQSSIKS